MKKVLGTSDAWWTIRLSYQPSQPGMLYYSLAMASGDCTSGENPCTLVKQMRYENICKRVLTVASNAMLHGWSDFLMM